MSSEFSTTVHGKWIVAGEHAVLRGSPALAFPVYGKSLTLRWSDADEFSPHFAGERGPEFQLLFTGVFDRSLELLGRSGDLTLRRGVFTVESSLPVGAGLGASAALSVAVGRWFAFRGAIAEPQLFDFCRNLEDLFHGESSGVDVAVALENRGLHFERGALEEKRMQGFDPTWQPLWYISYSGSRGITSECVAKVKSWLASNPIEGLATDQKMAAAVRRAEESLRANGRSEDQIRARFESLRQAIAEAGECFQTWGLSDGNMGRHLDWLKSQGAVAVKPTGSGGGGYALSLWQTRPEPDAESQLVPVFKVESSSEATSALQTSRT